MPKKNFTEGIEKIENWIHPTKTLMEYPVISYL